MSNPRINELPIVKTGEPAYALINGFHTVAAGVVDADFVEAYDSVIPVAIYGPLFCMFIGAGTGGVTATVRLELNGVIADERTVSPSTGTTKYVKLGSRSINEGAESTSNMRTDLPLPFNFGSVRMRVLVKVTVNTRSGSTDIGPQFRGHLLSPAVSIDEFTSFEMVSGTIVGKGSGDIGVEFTIASFSGRGRFFGVAAVGDSISSGAGQREYRLYVDGQEVMSKGPNPLHTTEHFHALGTVSPSYPEDNTSQDMRDQPLEFQGPNIHFDDSVILKCTITAHDAGPTSDYSGGFCVGNF